jgi:hypothetical protein
MKRLLGITALLVLTMAASQVWAQVIATRANTNAFVVGDNEACATPTFIPLNNVGSTSLFFLTTHDNQRVVVSFNAECSVRAANDFVYLDIEILVDGVAAVPSNGDDAYCTSDDDNQLASWVTAQRSVVAVLADPGFHSVQVRGTLIGCLDTAPRDDMWRIDDSTTIVQK